MLAYALYRRFYVKGEPLDSEQSTEKRYLGEDGEGYPDLRDALLFDNLYDARQATADMYNDYGQRWYMQPLYHEEALGIKKHQLCVKAEGLFSLPLGTPDGIVADRYEDAGMVEEAGTLRKPTFG